MLYLPTPTWYSLIPDVCTVFLYSSTSVNDSQLTNISDDDDCKTIEKNNNKVVFWIISLCMKEQYKILVRQNYILRQYEHNIQLCYSY